MESATSRKNNQSGCTQEATKPTSKTANQSNIAAATKVTRGCCCCWNRQRRLALLLITMTLAMLATHFPHSTHAAALSASSASSVEASAEEQNFRGDTDLDASLELTRHAQQPPSKGRRTRLRKRHTNHFYFHKHPQESATELEWENPCGGTFIGRTADAASADYDAHFQRQTMRQHMKDLRNAVKHQFVNSESHNDIKIDDMQMWQVHQNNYKFLPRLKPNSRISLKRWYRNMQTFVASFAYLGRTQYNWDRKQLQKASPISHELNDLFASARMLLCEIETAINGSHPQSGESKLTAVSRSQMTRRLNFHTRASNQQSSTAGVVEVRPLDLKYAKHYYIAYVRQMLRVLRKNTKRAPQQSRRRGGASSSSASYEDLDLSMNSALVDDSDSGSNSGSESIEMLLLEHTVAPTTTSRSSKRPAGHKRGAPKRRQQQQRTRKSSEQH